MNQGKRKPVDLHMNPNCGVPSKVPPVSPGHIEGLGEDAVPHFSRVNRLTAEK
jgi:hypothetical protein